MTTNPTPMRHGDPIAEDDPQDPAHYNDPVTGRRNVADPDDSMPPPMEAEAELAKAEAWWEAAEARWANLDRQDRDYLTGLVEVAAYTQGPTYREARVKGTGLIHGEELRHSVARYLPANYLATGLDDEGRVIVEGQDNAGWTLADYVIPRLASGLYVCEEVTA